MLKHAIILATVGLLGFAACKDEPREPDTDETVGEEVDEAVEDTGDAIDEAGDDTEEAIDEAGE